MVVGTGERRLDRRRELLEALFAPCVAHLQLHEGLAVLGEEEVVVHGVQNRFDAVLRLLQQRVDYFGEERRQVALAHVVLGAGRPQTHARLQVDKRALKTLPLGVLPEEAV